jgi:hypothetical protein
VDHLRCNHCHAPRDRDDNFCRRCGRQITINLPAVRESSLPAASRGVPPSLIGSVALLAVGTGLEWAARRLAGGAVRSVGRALVSQPKPAPPAKATPPSDAVTVDELIYVRQVRLHR